jgi:hypothetical protein
MYQLCKLLCCAAVPDGCRDSFVYPRLQTADRKHPSQSWSVLLLLPANAQFSAAT